MLLIKKISTAIRGALLMCALLTAGVFLTACTQHKVTPATTKSDASKTTNEAPTLIDDLERQVKEDPNNAELHYKLGRAYAANADKNKSTAEKKQAINAFRKVLELVPGNEVALSALYNLYYDDVVKGNNHSFAKAKAVFNQLPPQGRDHLNPPSLALFLQRYIAQKDAKEKSPNELLDALLAATREQPDSEKAYIQLAKMYRSQGLYPLALATLKQGEENNANSREFFQTMAETYEERAEASGCAYEKSDALYGAITYYQKAIPLSADQPELHYQLAQTYIDNNHFQLALNEIDIVLQLAPTAENYAWAAQSYSMLGKEQQAFEFLSKAKQQGLAESDTAFHEIYMNAGNWMQAALTFTGYLQTQREISIYDAIKADIIRDQTEWDFTKVTRGKKLSVRNEWEGAVYAYWTDKINRQQFERAARNRCERTEYYFYSGYRDYRAGNTLAARQHFQAALQQNTYRFIERPLASHFMERD